MKILLITDTFPPLRTSGAVQLRDLVRFFNSEGHKVTVMMPFAEQEKTFQLEDWEGNQLLRLKCPPIKDISYIRRTLGESLMPWVMYNNFKKSVLASEQWDGLIFYSPSIFFGSLVSKMKAQIKTKSYLILRDIFPEWALDMKLMRKGLIYTYFKWIANKQYCSADVIGVQTRGNLPYVQLWEKKNKKLEILPNWLNPLINNGCSINFSNTKLKGRKIIVYAGNMGVAQGMGELLEWIYTLDQELDLGFAFVGRGSLVPEIRKSIDEKRLSHIELFDEIDPDEIPGLYEQAHIGLLSLDRKHMSHNIPGKFISYMHAGLPVLACINANNDLNDLIMNEEVGYAHTEINREELNQSLYKITNNTELRLRYSQNARKLADKMFSTKVVGNQIIKHFER